MGAKHNKPFSWEQGNEYRIIEKNLNDGTVILVKEGNDQQFMGRQLICKSKQEEKDIKRLINLKMNNKNAYLTKLVVVAESEEMQYCYSKKVFYLLFEKLGHTLREEILTRKFASEKFSQQEASIILQSGIKGLKQLKNLSHPHTNISSSSFFVSNNRQIILGDPWITPPYTYNQTQNNNPSSYNLQNISACPSPEKIQFQNDQIMQYCQHRSDLFSLGMVILEVLYFQHMDILYEKGFRRLIEEKVRQKISKIKDQNLRDKLRALLAYEPRDRDIAYTWFRDEQKNNFMTASEARRRQIRKIAKQIEDQAQYEPKGMIIRSKQNSSKTQMTQLTNYPKQKNQEIIKNSAFNHHNINPHREIHSNQYPSVNTHNIANINNTYRQNPVNFQYKAPTFNTNHMSPHNINFNDEKKQLIDRNINKNDAKFFPNQNISVNQVNFPTSINQPRVDSIHNNYNAKPIGFYSNNNIVQPSNIISQPIMHDKQDLNPEIKKQPVQKHMIEDIKSSYKDQQNHVIRSVAFPAENNQKKSTIKQTEQVVNEKKQQEKNQNSEIFAQKTDHIQIYEKKQQPVTQEQTIPKFESRYAWNPQPHQNNRQVFKLHQKTPVQSLDLESNQESILLSRGQGVFVPNKSLSENSDKHILDSIIKESQNSYPNPYTASYRVPSSGQMHGQETPERRPKKKYNSTIRQVSQSDNESSQRFSNNQNLHSLSSNLVSQPHSSGSNSNQYQKVNASAPINTSNQELVYVEEEYDTGRYWGYKNSKTNMRQGHGKFVYKEGSIYDGDWKDNMMDGYGTLYYSNGKIAYQGQWKLDEFHGNGNVYNQDDSISQSGYKNNQQMDYSNLDDMNECWIFYGGQLNEDRRHGKGKLKFNNGQIFVGNFNKDIADGEGKYYTLSGEVINGIWKNNKLVKRL